MSTQKAADDAWKSYTEKNFFVIKVTILLCAKLSGILQ